MNGTLTVYSPQSCVRCNTTYRALDKLKAEYEDFTYEVIQVDIEENAADRDLIMSLGHTEAPGVVIRDSNGNIVDHWSGFRPDRLKAAVVALMEPALQVTRAG